MEKYPLQSAVSLPAPIPAFSVNAMRKLPLSLFFLLAGVGVCAQTAPVTNADSGNFYARFSTRVNQIQSHQPNWPPPLVTTYTGLFQVARTDMLHQITTSRTSTWNYDNGKGVAFIPWDRTEIDVNLPAYIQHNTPTAADGAGDMSFLGKVRLASGNEQHGTYNICVFAVATIPTGSYKNGSTDASIAPNLAVGKGVGRFALQPTGGVTLYTGRPATTRAGNPVSWNTAAQYRVGKIFWPEIESNATYFKGGAHSGQVQEFITPGVLVGKCKLHPEDPHSRAGAAFGVGMQVATSHYYTYNHGLVMTARWIF